MRANNDVWWERVNELQRYHGNNTAEVTDKTKAK